MAKAKKEAEKVEEAVEAQDIIRGRMPVAIAAAIKLSEDTDAKDSDLASKYRTTNGKISDIRAGRNFAYVTEDFKPTKEMVTAAKAYAEQLDDEKPVMKTVKAFGVATEEEAEAFATNRKSTRKSPGKPKKAEVEEEDEDEDEDEDEEEEDLDDLLDEN